MEVLILGPSYVYGIITGLCISDFITKLTERNRSTIIIIIIIRTEG